jgi:hypothetical protein
MHARCDGAPSNLVHLGVGAIAVFPKDLGGIIKAREWVCGEAAHADEDRETAHGTVGVPASPTTAKVSQLSGGGFTRTPSPPVIADLADSFRSCCKFFFLPFLDEYTVCRFLSAQNFR